MTQYLLPVALPLVVLLPWHLYVRAVRREQRRIILRFTASSKGMVEAMNRMTTAMRQVNEAMAQARAAGVFDDHSESP